MNCLKRLYLHTYRQLGARKNLYHLRDGRAFAPILGQVLAKSAVLWPEVLPWKPRTYLDVGAYQGKVAEQITQLYRPRFIGLVEPQPEMVALLRERTFAPHQMVFACALGCTSGTASLNVLASSLSERDNFSVGQIDDKLVPCLSYSSELIAGSRANDSQVQDD